MFHLERILVPVDFSDNSLIAVRDAGSLARVFHSEVTLLHINEFLVFHPLSGPLGYGISSTEAQRTEHVNWRRKQLDGFATAELQDVAVKKIVCSGDPAKLIAEFARNQSSDLIVMPTRGYGPFRRFLLGSVTAKILHDVDCPVWTGAHLEKAPASPFDIHHVMCAVNFGPRSCHAIRWAADFASQLGAKLTVIHAVLESPSGLPDRYTFQWHEESQWGAKERLRGLLLDTGVAGEALVVSDGDIAHSVAEAAREKEAGLLVIGRSCAGSARSRLGSHTYPIICGSTCPVVSI